MYYSTCRNNMLDRSYIFDGTASIVDCECTTMCRHEMSLNLCVQINTTNPRRTEPFANSIHLFSTLYSAVYNFVHIILPIKYIYVNQKRNAMFVPIHTPFATGLRLELVTSSLLL